jgi:hypothetical protein
MDSITIVSGVKKIAINSDPDRVISFNPTDVVFAEKFYNLLGEFQDKLKEYQDRSAIIEAAAEVDENNLPVNLPDRIALMREVCEYMRGRIDYLFGPDTAQKVFEDALSLDMFEQFFTGITPFIQQARADKVSKYSNKPPKRGL